MQTRWLPRWWADEKAHGVADRSATDACVCAAEADEKAPTNLLVVRQRPTGEGPPDQAATDALFWAGAAAAGATPSPSSSCCLRSAGGVCAWVGGWAGGWGEGGSELEDQRRTFVSASSSAPPPSQALPSLPPSLPPARPKPYLRREFMATWAAFCPDTNIAPNVGPIRGHPSSSATSMPQITMPGMTS